VRMFYYSDLWNLCSFSVEEELSCEAQSCIGALCRRVKILTFQVTAHIGLLKEGGKIKSLKKLSWAGTEFSEGANFWLFFRKQSREVGILVCGQSTVQLPYLKEN